MERYYIAKGMLATETGVLEQFPLGIPEFLIEVCKAADAQQRITDLEQQVQALNKERDEYMSKEGPSDGFWGRNCARLLEREKLAQAALRRAKAEGRQEGKEYALNEAAMRAGCAAHRACCGIEADNSQGKIHGYCVVCGVPWPCETAQFFLFKADARAAQIEEGE